jgi:hypothetical protein
MRDQLLLNKLLFCFSVIHFFWYGLQLCSLSYCVCSVEQPVHMGCHLCATHVYAILMCGVAMLPGVLVLQEPTRISGLSCAYSGREGKYALSECILGTHHG